VLEETQEQIERREELDGQLARFVGSTVRGGRPDRATWGRTPAQQRAMRAAIAAGGGDAKARG
jgi:hypothetical protein